MKILFVDDEKLILSAIQRSLFDTGWDISCANSGEEALNILAKEKYDVIVSDMRMPYMNGAELLEKIFKLYPDTVRIILSGHADKNLSLQSSFVAHQWLDKPCDRELLINTLKHIEIGINELPNNTIKLTVGRTNALPSPPKTFIKIKKILDSRSGSIETISEIIEKDPALSAKILQLTNSSFFLRGKEITNIKDAVIRLGFELVNNIVLLAESYSKTLSYHPLDTNKEQLNSLIISKLAAYIAPHQHKESAMLAGLLHKIGKYVLIQVFPEKLEHYASILKSENHSDLSLLEHEQDLFQVNHAQIGGYLLFLWGFPSAIIDGVLHHDNLKLLLQRDFDAPAAIYIANMLLNKLDIDPQFIQHFHLQNKLAEWENFANTLLKGQ